MSNPIPRATTRLMLFVLLVGVVWATGFDAGGETTSLAAAQTLDPESAVALDPPLFTPIPAGRSQAAFPDRAFGGAVVQVDTEQFLQPTLTVNLPDGNVVTAHRTHLSESSGGLQWLGRTTEDPNSLIAFSVRDDVVAGLIEVGDSTWEVTATAVGDHHTIFRLDPTLALNAEPGDAYELPSVEPAASGASRADRSRRAEADDPAEIDVLVVYTPSALDYYVGRGLEPTLDLTFAIANAFYEDSGIHVQFRHVQTVPLGYDTTTSAIALLHILRPDDGNADEIHSLRDQYGADLVMAVTAPGGGPCGRATKPFRDLDEKAAYSIVSTSCLLGSTTAHELGHNLGLGHSRDQSSLGLLPYGQGYRECGTLHTIMAYACAGSRRVDQFSDPDAEFGGRAIGVDHDLDPDNSADAVRAANEVVHGVAAYRATVSPGTPPEAPTLAAAVGRGPSTIEVSWADQADDESGYRIERSTSDGPWAVVGSTDADVRSHLDTSVVAGVAYRYRVFAENESGRSAAAETATTFSNEPAIATEGINVEGDCVGGNGVIRVRLLAAAGGGEFVATMAQFERRTTLSAGEAGVLYVSGRPDGTLPVEVRQNGTLMHRSRQTIDCDPGDEITTTTSCVRGNGRVDVRLVNVTDADAAYRVTIDTTAPRLVLLAPQQEVTVTRTGRPNRNFQLSVDRDGTRLALEAPYIVCAPLFRVECNDEDPGPPPTEVPLRTSGNSPMVDLGTQLEVILYQEDLRTVVWRVEAQGHDAVTVAVAARGVETVSFEVPPSGAVPVSVWFEDTLAYRGRVQVNCETPPARITHSCLAGNGRIDVLITNEVDDPPNGLDRTYTVTFGDTLSRSAVLPDGVLRTLTVTGRPDGPIDVEVREELTPIFSETVNIACD